MTIKDLDDVLTSLEVGFFDKQWTRLGLALGLYEGTLSTIEKNNPKDVDGCIEKCLAQWLKRADGVDEKGGPTWTTLANALCDRNNKSAAEHISESLCLSLWITTFYYYREKV